MGQKNNDQPLLTPKCNNDVNKLSHSSLQCKSDEKQHWNFACVSQTHVDMDHLAHEIWFVRHFWHNGNPGGPNDLFLANSGCHQLASNISIDGIAFFLPTKQSNVENGVHWLAHNQKTHIFPLPWPCENAGASPNHHQKWKSYHNR